MAQWIWVQISSTRVKKKKLLSRQQSSEPLSWRKQLQSPAGKPSPFKTALYMVKHISAIWYFNCHPQPKSRHTTFKSWPTMERKPKNFNQHFVTAKKKNPNNPGLDPALWWIVDGRFRFAQWGALWCSEAGFKRASEDLMSSLWSKTLSLISASKKSGEIYFIWKQCRQTYPYFNFQRIIECVTKILVQAKRRHKTKPSKLLKYRMVE